MGWVGKPGEFEIFIITCKGSLVIPLVVHICWASIRNSKGSSILKRKTNVNLHREITSLGGNNWDKW